MAQSILQNNPYEKVYREAEINIHEHIGKSEAENLVRHIGLVYNTFGVMMKDLIKVVSYKFTSSQVDKPQTNVFLKEKDNQQINNVFTQQKKQAEVKNGHCRQSIELQTKKTGKQKKNKSKQNKRTNDLQKIEYNYDEQFDRELGSFKYQKQSVRSLRSESQERSDSCSKVYTELLKNKRESKKSQNQSKGKQNSVIIIEEEENMNINLMPSPAIINQVPKRFQGREDEFFSINPNDNSNSSVRVLPGRTKKEREQFPGIACVDCQKYYKSLGIDVPKLCECTSRHKASIPMHHRQKYNFTQQLDLD